MVADDTQPGSPSGRAAFKPLGTIGRYEIVAELGSGQFGRVYRGYYRDLDRDVAIKVPVDANPTPELRDLFLQEARAAAKVKHQFVCEIYEVGEEGNRPFIVMPFIESGTLADELRRTPLPPIEVALARTRDIALGLEAAHRKGLLHRDIKPANVLFDTENQRVLLTDFGLAKLIDATASRAIRGTPLYMSPEQWHPEGGQKPGPASDVYSLGCILYQMLTGITPHECPDGNVFALGFAVLNTPIRPPSTVNPRLDSRYDALCSIALSRNPTQRYASAKALAEAIDTLVRSVPSAATPQPIRRQLVQVLGEADYLRGEEYFHGRARSQDYEKAREYYFKAATHNYPAAQFSLGGLYANGQGVPQDYAAAYEWYLRAANLGHAATQANLAFLYYFGRGVERDYTNARRWYLKAKAQCGFFGKVDPEQLIAEDRGGAKEMARAFALYREAAAQGNEYAKNLLSMLDVPE